jgi:DNA-binding NarL/FixJ family response regulator
MNETAKTPIRLLLGDAHPLVIAGVRRSLEHSDEIEIAGEASSPEQLLALIERRRPSAVLMDFMGPGMNGPACIGEIRERWPLLKVIVLSARDDRESIDMALDAGATTYVLKSINPAELQSVITQVTAGNVFHRAAARPPAQTAVSQSGPTGPGLTQRELMILTAVADGRSTAAISRDECVSEHTVKFHLSNIYRKLGVSNRVGAVRYALERDLVAN